MPAKILERKGRWLATIATIILLVALLVPQSILAGVIFIPIGGVTAENSNGYRLQVRFRGEGSDLNGMTGRARFRDGTTGETTNVRIADSEIEMGSSELVFLNTEGNPVVILDFAGAQGVEVTWVPDGGVTFVSGIDLVNFNLRGTSRDVPE